MQGAPISDPITEGTGQHIAFSLIDVDQMSFACPQRVPDGSCEIYETPPVKCRVVPVDETVPASDAARELRAEIAHLRKHGGTCVTDASAPSTSPKPGADAAQA